MMRMFWSFVCISTLRVFSEVAGSRVGTASGSAGLLLSGAALAVIDRVSGGHCEGPRAIGSRPGTSVSEIRSELSLRVRRLTLRYSRQCSRQPSIALLSARWRHGRLVVLRLRVRLFVPVWSDLPCLDCWQAAADH